MVDALQAIASAHGYEVNIRTIPEKREALMLDRGIIDARAKAKEWVKVDPEQYTWTDPVIMISVVVFFPKESTKKLQHTRRFGRVAFRNRFGIHLSVPESLFRRQSHSPCRCSIRMVHFEDVNYWPYRCCNNG